MLKEIRLQELTPSPTNPRKTFDPLKLEELARSIAEVGVLEPILVRRRALFTTETSGVGTRWAVVNPHGVTLSTYPTELEAHTEAEALTQKHGYEVVAGERRYRAATIAGVETVPRIVRDLTDVQALEIQTLENLQRDDLHPLEEAAGFAALMKEAGYDVERIAHRISKSLAYVYDRVKLLQLVPEAQKIFLDGEITAGHAVLLARLSSADQERAIGGTIGGWQLTGLFEPDRAHDVPGLELGDHRKRKAVSVREFQTWIDNNVRFRPSEVDLPNLFPETAAALEAAREEELKVVKITHDYRAPDGIRDEKERTYGRPSWKRADGEMDGDGIWAKRKPSKTCDHSVMGIVVGGPGRGDAFLVCVAKKKCKVHWGAEMKAAEARANGGGAAAAADQRSQAEAQRDRYAEQQRKDQEERARWAKAAPQLLRALVEKLNATPPMDLVDVILEECRAYGFLPDAYMQRGDTIEEAVRYAAFLVLSNSVTNNWSAPTLAPKALKPFGIDAKKIVDQVAPKPKAVKPKKANGKAAAEVEEKPTSGARARRRSKKGADAVHVDG